MGWADGHITRLLKGETVSFRPRGNSMRPRINDGDLCTVVPASGDDESRAQTIKPGDVVLCEVKGSQYLHLVKAVNGDRYQIGNNHGGINGWIGKNRIYGRLVSVER